MVSDWIETTLGDVCTMIKRGISPKYVVEGGIPVINQRCIRNQVVSFEDIRFHDISKKNIPQDRYLINGDILINSTGVGTLGRVAQLKNYEGEITFDSHVTVARINQNSGLDNDFLGWVVKCLEPIIERLGEGSTGQTELSRQRVAELVFRYPKNLVQQRAIAQILSSLDTKIELNRQMDQTLEQMAQILYKSWFVDFDPVIDNVLAVGNPIPEELDAKAEQRKSLGNNRKPLPEHIQKLFPAEFEYCVELEKWVPKGWKVGKVIDVSDVFGGGTPSTSIPEYFCEEGIPWLSPKDLSGYEWKFISRGATDISELGLKKSSAKLMPNGTVLFSSRAPIGYIAIAENEISTNQGFKSLVPKRGIPSEYLFYYLKSMTTEIEAISTGSTFKEVSGNAMKSLGIIIPSIEVLQQYKLETDGFNDKRRVNQKEVKTLTTLRDTLLPKLISGEITIPN